MDLSNYDLPLGIHAYKNDSLVITIEGYEGSQYIGILHINYQSGDSLNFYKYHTPINRIGKTINISDSAIAFYGINNSDGHIIFTDLYANKIGESTYYSDTFTTAKFFTSGTFDDSLYMAVVCSFCVEGVIAHTVFDTEYNSKEKNKIVLNNMVHSYINKLFKVGKYLYGIGFFQEKNSYVRRGLIYKSYLTSDINFGNKTGRVYLDSDLNKSYTSGDKGIPNSLLQTISLFSLSDQNGNYNIGIQEGRYDSIFLINPDKIKYYQLVKPSIGYYSFLPDSNLLINDSLDFIFQPIPDIYDLETDLTGGFARPGFEVNYYLQTKNIGTETADSVEVTFHYPTELTYLSSTDSIYSQTDSTVTFLLDSLTPQALSNIRATCELDRFTPLGSELTTYYQLKV